MYKASLGGGFWGLANWMTKADREMEFNAAVDREVNETIRRLAAEKGKEVWSQVKSGCEL